MKKTHSLISINQKITTELGIIPSEALKVADNIIH